MVEVNWIKTAERLPTVERKLAPEWQELRADSWEGVKPVWLLAAARHYRTCRISDSCIAFEGGYKHWQMILPPRVYEDQDR
jgi:hypothetical protein